MGFKYFIKEDDTTIGFSTDSTGVTKIDDILSKPTYHEQEKNLVARIVYISPKKYLEKTAEGFGKSYDELMDDPSLEKKRAQKYADMMKDGVKFDMPYFDNTTNSFSQEGRHRALGAMIVGIKQIPVVIVNYARLYDHFPRIRTEL